MLIYNSPQLIAVNRVLLRLLMPRHSPCALGRLHFYMLFSLYELSEFHFTNIGYYLIREKADTFVSFPLLNLFHLALSRIGEIVVITHLERP